MQVSFMGVTHYGPHHNLDILENIIKTTVGR